MTVRALKEKVSDIRRIARLHGVSRVRVFAILLVLVSLKDDLLIVVKDA